MNLKSLIRDIPDFPKKNILFRDISPLLANPQALDYVAEVFAQNLNLQDTHYFGGIESRGFILATLMSAKFKKGFIPIRKAGKLPPPVFQESYDLEYGSATLEAQPGQGNIIILDDVLATGGTLQASIKVCQSAGYKVLEVGTLINLKNLNQFLFNDQKPFSILEY